MKGTRLAFSIACLVKPDILILDEVLSVGDGAFRKKSEAKMRKVIDGGATTILVSHSLPQVRQMCTKVLWLHKGKQIDYGTDVQGICDRYQQFLDGNLKGNTAQSAIGASWKNSALTLSLFLAIHKVFLQKTAFIRTQIFSGFALTELCGVALAEVDNRFLHGILLLGVFRHAALPQFKLRL